MQAARARAKALVENKKASTSVSNQINQAPKQKIDPNLFTCKYCTGTIDQVT